MEEPSGRTIRVGLIAPALGTYRSVGADITNGFKLYLEDHDGRLGRHDVDLKVEDEGGTPASARAAADNLLTAGVIALAGVANPAALIAIRDAVEKAKVPLICSNASPTTLTSAFYIWRASYVEGEAGRALAPYAYGDGKRAYLLYDDAAMADASEFKRAFQDLGGTIVGEVAGPGTSFGSRLQQANAASPTALFCAYSGAAAQDVLEAYRRSGIEAKLIGPGSLTETIDLAKLLDKGASLPARVYTAMPYAYDLDNQANRRFVSGYHKTYGLSPSVYAMIAYDSAAVLDRALRLIDGEPNAALLNKAFSALGQIDSPRGAWTFNLNRTPQQKWYLRRLRMDGQVPGNLLDADLAVLS